MTFFKHHLRHRQLVVDVVPESSGLSLFALILFDIFQFGADICFLSLVLLKIRSLSRGDYYKNRSGKSENNNAQTKHYAHDVISFFECDEL